MVHFCHVLFLRILVTLTFATSDDGSSTNFKVRGTEHCRALVSTPASDSSDAVQMLKKNKSSSVCTCLVVETVKEFEVDFKVSLTLDVRLTGSHDALFLQLTVFTSSLSV